MGFEGVGVGSLRLHHGDDFFTRRLAVVQG